jgi:hypothetical protein
MHGATPQKAVIPRESGVPSTLRLLDSITGVSGILGRPVEPGDDGWECGAFALHQSQLSRTNTRKNPLHAGSLQSEHALE